MMWEHQQYNRRNPGQSFSWRKICFKLIMFGRIARKLTLSTRSFETWWKATLPLPGGWEYWGAYVWIGFSDAWETKRHSWHYVWVPLFSWMDTVFSFIECELVHGDHYTFPAWVAATGNCCQKNPWGMFRLASHCWPILGWHINPSWSTVIVLTIFHGSVSSSIWEWAFLNGGFWTEGVIFRLGVLIIPSTQISKGEKQHPKKGG